MSKRVIDLDIAAAMDPLVVRVGGKDYETRALSFVEAERWRRRFESLDQASDEDALNGIWEEFFAALELPKDLIMSLGSHAILAIVEGFYVALGQGPTRGTAAGPTPEKPASRLPGRASAKTPRARKATSHLQRS